MWDTELGIVKFAKEVQNARVAKAPSRIWVTEFGMFKFKLAKRLPAICKGTVPNVDL